jgi:dolichol kinase
MDLNFSFSALMASLIFGIFGMYLFKLARKRSHGLLIGISVALMVYPYFVTNVFLTWAIGIVLTVVGYKMALN